MQGRPTIGGVSRRLSEEGANARHWSRTLALGVLVVAAGCQPVLAASMSWTVTNHLPYPLQVVALTVSTGVTNAAGAANHGICSTMPRIRSRLLIAGEAKSNLLRRLHLPEPRPIGRGGFNNANSCSDCCGVCGCRVDGEHAGQMNARGRERWECPAGHESPPPSSPPSRPPAAPSAAPAATPPAVEFAPVSEPCRGR